MNGVELVPELSATFRGAAEAVAPPLEPKALRSMSSKQLKLLPVVDEHSTSFVDVVAPKSRYLQRPNSVPFFAPDISEEHVAENIQRRQLHSRLMQKDSSAFRRKRGEDAFASFDCDLRQKNQVLLGETHPYIDEKALVPKKHTKRRVAKPPSEPSTLIATELRHSMSLPVYDETTPPSPNNRPRSRAGSHAGTHNFSIDPIAIEKMSRRPRSTASRQSRVRTPSGFDASDMMVMSPSSANGNGSQPQHSGSTSSLLQHHSLSAVDFGFAPTGSSGGLTLFAGNETDGGGGNDMMMGGGGGVTGGGSRMSHSRSMSSSTPSGATRGLHSSHSHASLSSNSNNTKKSMTASEAGLVFTTHCGGEDMCVVVGCSHGMKGAAALENDRIALGLREEDFEPVRPRTRGFSPGHIRSMTQKSALEVMSRAVAQPVYALTAELKSITHTFVRPTSSREAARGYHQSVSDDRAWKHKRKEDMLRAHHEQGKRQVEAQQVQVDLENFEKNLKKNQRY